jgi:hypothetical protein
MLAAACGLFGACGYVQEAVFTDYVLEDPGSRAESGCRAGSSDPARREAAAKLVIPMTVDDLAANGLLEDGPPVCWERSIETLTARKDEITGLAVASEERIDAYVLHADGAILSLRSLVDDDAGARLNRLLADLRARVRPFRFPKVQSSEISKETLASLGFRPAGEHLLYAARAQSA